jgi:hypothetical protein
VTSYTLTAECSTQRLWRTTSTAICHILTWIEQIEAVISARRSLRSLKKKILHFCTREDKGAGGGWRVLKPVNCVLSGKQWRDTCQYRVHSRVRDSRIVGKSARGINMSDIRRREIVSAE